MYNVENWSILTDKQLGKLNADSIFDFIDKSSLDSLHRKLLKYTLGVNKSSPNISIYGDTGEIPLSIKGYPYGKLLASSYQISRDKFGKACS